MCVYEDEALISHAPIYQADVSSRGELMVELMKLQLHRRSLHRKGPSHFILVIYYFYLKWHLNCISFKSYLLISIPGK